MRATVDVPTRPETLTEVRSSARLSHGGVWVVAAGALLGAVFLALRYRLALTPTLAETYYDEALTGLMGLAILHGDPQVFYWGEPYGGAIGDAYPAALGFWLFGPSTLVLRMVSAVIAVLWAWSLWFSPAELARGRSPSWRGSWLQCRPSFSATPSCRPTGRAPRWRSARWPWPAPRTWSMRARLGREPRPGRSSASPPALSWWSSQIGTMLLARRRRRPHRRAAPGPPQRRALRGPRALLPRELALLGVEHTPRLGHVPAPRDLGRAAAAVEHRFEIVGVTLLESLRDYFWDGRAVRLPSWARILSWITVLGVYVPGLFVAVARVIGWTQRLRRRERPWRDALDVVVVAFWITVAAHFLTWFGTSTVLRYEITFQATLPVLCAVALARVGAAGWTPPRGGYSRPRCSASTW